MRFFLPTLVVYLASLATMFVGIAELPACGSTPRLNLILPRGVQRGGEHTLRFVGERLSDTQEVFLYATGIEIVDFNQVDDKNVDVTIKVDDDCRPGEHIAQLRTAEGISDYRSFYVGAMSEINEVEPNGELSTSQTIEPNTTVNGVINNEDVDVFRIAAKKGDRLSVEIEAIRLGVMFDPFIAVLDSQNFEIAISDDSILGQQDGIISLQLPEDGDYFVLVRESSYGGNGNCRYRLHAGSFPRPTVAFPAAGQPGEEVEIKFLGDSLGPIVKTVQVPESPGFRSGIFVADERGVSPSPIGFLISELQNHFETEPNADRNKVENCGTAPCALNGVIAKPGDMDYFKFTANKSESFDVECVARRIGSGLDPVINVFHANGKHIVGDDDARRPDSYLRFTAPETGEYFVRVRDHLDRGQDDFVYRVELKSLAPGLSLSIPRVDRYSQLRQQICVPQGNRFATMISATRSNFAGQLRLMTADWPEGVTVDAKPMVANLNLMPVVFTATPEAELSGKLVDLQACHLDETKNIIGHFMNTADFALGPPNNSRFFTADVNKLACAVIRKLPFKIDIVQPQVPLVRNGSMNLKIVATREEGFDEPIIVQFPFRPPGLGTKPQIQIPKGKSEAVYPLNANGSAQLGKWPVYAIGQSNVNGPAWASSQLAEIEIAEPLVSVEMNRTSCHQGETTEIYCKLGHRLPFTGQATAELLGVPPNIEIPKLTFTAETKELVFNVTTSNKSPIGKHKGLFCRLTIVQNDEAIVSTAARSELQINPPKPAAPAAATGVAAKPVEPAAVKPKPKSRLQQLREAAKQKGG